MGKRREKREGRRFALEREAVTLVGLNNVMGDASIVTEFGKKALSNLRRTLKLALSENTGARALPKRGCRQHLGHVLTLELTNSTTPSQIVPNRVSRDPKLLAATNSVVFV